MCFCIHAVINYMKFYYEIYHNADGFIKLFTLLKSIIYKEYVTNNEVKKENICHYLWSLPTAPESSYDCNIEKTLKDFRINLGILKIKFLVREIYTSHPTSSYQAPILNDHFYSIFFHDFFAFQSTLCSVFHVVACSCSSLIYTTIY